MNLKFKQNLQFIIDYLNYTFYCIPIVIIKYISFNNYFYQLKYINKI